MGVLGLEEQRLAELHSLRLLDTGREAVFEAIVENARLIFDTPISAVSLVDQNRQWFKAESGLGIQETARAVSFCSHAIEDSSVFTVTDARADQRFCENPLVAGSPFIRFYAGAPLITPRGFKLGTLCIIDRRERLFSEAEATQLQELAEYAVVAIEMHRAGRPLDRVQAMLTDFLATV